MPTYQRKLGYNWGEFNVMDYGAKGDGSNDDRNAFQAAFDAAIVFRGTVVIPPPDNYYKIGSTINVLPGPSNQVYVDVRANGWGTTGPAPIRYTGANRTKVFNIVGLKKSIWSGLAIDIDPARNEIIVFDIDTTASANSSTYVTWKNCHVNLDNTYTVAWRTGHISGGNGDIANHQWENCTVYGTDEVGQIGYLNEGTNVLSMTWQGGFTAHVQNIYSNLSGTHYQPGDDSTSDRGNGSVFFYGMGGSGNDCDYVFTYEQAYLINGGRYESGGMFMTTGTGNHHPAITISNVEINDYASAEDPLIEMKTAGTLKIINSRMIRTGGWGVGKPMITLNNSGNVGTLIIDGGGTKADEVFRILGGSWKVEQRGLAHFSDDNGVFTDRHYLNLPSATLVTDTTTVGNVGTGEDSLFSYTLPKNTLFNNGNTIKGRVQGNLALNGNSKRLRLKFGASTIVDTFVNIAFVINDTWSIDFEITRTGPNFAVYNAMIVNGDGQGYSTSGSTAPAFNTDIVIAFTGEATATNDIQKRTMKMFTLE